MLLAGGCSVIRFHEPTHETKLPDHRNPQQRRADPVLGQGGAAAATDDGDVRLNLPGSTNVIDSSHSGLHALAGRIDGEALGCLRVAEDREVVPKDHGPRSSVDAQSPPG